MHPELTPDSITNTRQRNSLEKLLGKCRSSRALRGRILASSHHSANEAIGTIPHLEGFDGVGDGWAIDALEETEFIR